MKATATFSEDLLTREEVLQGLLPDRRVSLLLFLIETKTMEQRARFQEVGNRRA